MALLKLAQLPYNGATSLFIRVLLNKKYALPYKVGLRAEVLAHDTDESIEGKKIYVKRFSEYNFELFFLRVGAIFYYGVFLYICSILLFVQDKGITSMVWMHAW